MTGIRGVTSHQAHLCMASGLPALAMLVDRQAAFAKQCAEASPLCGDWRKISARKNPEIGELRQKSVVQIPDHPSPHVLPRPSGLGKLVWSTWASSPAGARGVLGVGVCPPIHGIKLFA